MYRALCVREAHCQRMSFAFSTRITGKDLFPKYTHILGRSTTGSSKDASFTCTHSAAAYVHRMCIVGRGDTYLRAGSESKMPDGNVLRALLHKDRYLCAPRSLLSVHVSLYTNITESAIEHANGCYQMFVYLSAFVLQYYTRDGL